MSDLSVNYLTNEVKDIDDEIISLHNMILECKIRKNEIIRKLWLTCDHNWMENPERYYGDISGKVCSKCKLCSNRNLYF